MMSGGGSGPPPQPPQPRQVRQHHGEAGGHRTATTATASDPEMEDEDSCNMTAVDPTSMLRSCDDKDEVPAAAAMSARQQQQQQNTTSQQQQKKAAEGSKLMAIMNSMRKSEKRKFHMFLQHLANSNNRSVDLKQLNDMLSRLSDEAGGEGGRGGGGGKWRSTASSSLGGGPASPGGGGAATAAAAAGIGSHRRTPQLPPHPNYDHILPPNLETSRPESRTHQHHHHPSYVQQGAASLLQVADAAAAAAANAVPLSIPVGDTSLLVTRNAAAATAATTPEYNIPHHHHHLPSSAAAVLTPAGPLSVAAGNPVEGHVAQFAGLSNDARPPASRVDPPRLLGVNAAVAVAAGPPVSETRKRYKRTEQILQEAGMYDIAMQTRELEKKNKELQAEIDQFNRDANTFLQGVLKNPQNKWLRDKMMQTRSQQQQTRRST